MGHTLFSLDGFFLGVRRGETPLFKVLKTSARRMMKVNLPVPRSIKPIGRLLYELRIFTPIVWRRLKCALWCHPIFACRCEALGKGLELEALPCVEGHTSIYIGNDVRFSGALTISSGRFDDHPSLRIGDRSFLGHNVTIICNREVVIEEDVLIAGHCKISDYDGHPSNLEKRLGDSPPDRRDIRPVRICRGAWIGVGSTIMKGVTVGEGAVIGAHSVVTNDIPAYSVAAGSPARVVKQVEAVPASVWHPSQAAELAGIL